MRSCIDKYYNYVSLNRLLQSPIFSDHCVCQRQPWRNGWQKTSTLITFARACDVCSLFFNEKMHLVPCDKIASMDKNGKDIYFLSNIFEQSPRFISIYVRLLYREILSHSGRVTYICVSILCHHWVR